jgi:hypothetical protein
MNESLRRTCAVALSLAADFLNQVAFETMPPKPKRVRTVKPGWVKEMEQVHRHKDDEPV